MQKLRRILTAGALAAAVALPATVMANIASAKTLVVGVQADLTGLDPSNTNDTLSQSAEKMIFQGLYGFDKNMKLIPVLATSYDVNKQATQFTFHLRHDVKFQDGTPFDAQAVKVNIERLADKNNHLSRYSLVSMLDHVKVIDKYTVEVLLKTPFGAFVNNTAHPGMLMISPAALKKYGKTVSRHPVGTGPFTFKSWSADTLEVVRNKDYWKEGLPKVDGVTVKSVPENGSRVAMLLTGEAQFIAPVPPEMVTKIKSDPKVDLANQPSIVTVYASMNTMKKPFDNPMVRQALNYAVNKKAFCKVVMSGFCTTLDSPLPPLLRFYKKQGPWPYDPQKAKQLLAKAGYPNGFSTSIVAQNNTTSIRAMQFLQQQFAQVGVTLKVTPLEAGVLNSKVFSVDKPEDSSLALYYAGWSSSTGDADWALRPLFASSSFPPNLFNTAYYHNPAVDKDLEGAVETADADKRGAFYADAQKKIWKDAPWVFLVVDRVLSAHSKDVSGVYVLPDRGFSVENAAFSK